MCCKHRPSHSMSSTPLQYCNNQHRSGRVLRRRNSTTHCCCGGSRKQRLWTSEQAWLCVGFATGTPVHHHALTLFLARMNAPPRKTCGLCARHAVSYPAKCIHITCRTRAQIERKELSTIQHQILGHFLLPNHQRPRHAPAGTRGRCCRGRACIHALRTQRS